MVFSRECEYAFKGLATLATEAAARPVMVSQIAALERLPLSFLRKIFQKLLQHGLIQSHRGARRGYTLVRPAAQITLREILEAIQGPDLFDRCLFAHYRCAEQGACLVHLAWQDVQPQVQAAFERTTLQDLLNARAAAVSRPGRRSGGKRKRISDATAAPAPVSRVVGGGDPLAH
ncbi:MAG: Rrf2 family transcriptional regulator [Chloroflexi bacterium]|nr:Rrf2 family transcriptional regulator [Chloroflexota bacterium]